MTAVLERHCVDLSELKNLVTDKVLLNHKVANYTTYHLGGPAAAFVEPHGVEDLASLLRCLTHGQVPYLMLGGGSNVLFADEGYQGVVIRLGRSFQGIHIEGDRVRVKAGTQLVTVLSKTREANLGGVEFFAGIPGTIGGAVVGNAGAKKAWIGPTVEELTIVTPRGEVKHLKKSEYEYGYRYSSLKLSGNVLVEVVLKLKKEPKAEIEKKVKEYFSVRRGKQPRVEKNAGSVFKNPEGNFAGRLTQSVGLKGFQVGGAKVSDIHANFIVNDGTGTAHDVVAVMREIQKRVYGEYQIKLEPEILPLGDWNWDEIKDVFWNLERKGKGNFQL
ncbi:MAG TPA: UDP-N-acetylmuramate dehydrogenase [bacterium]|nr:UDP-N-acetylmuramate dehydrogenase [bacterium]